MTYTVHPSHDMGEHTPPMRVGDSSFNWCRRCYQGNKGFGIILMCPEGGDKLTIVMPRRNK